MFDTIAQIFKAILTVIPRICLVRPTHRGIKFKRGKLPVELKPGIHLYWPILSEVDEVVVARQTITLPSQVLETEDGHSIVISGYVVIRITDVILAFGETNWDVTGTVDDICRAAIVDVVHQHTLEQIKNGLTTELTRACRKRLKSFGVGVVKAGITDLCRCKVHRVVGNPITSNTVSVHA